MELKQVDPNGWISVVVEVGNEESAKQIRAERDRVFGNIFSEQDSDMRWVGDLAEIVFDFWMSHAGKAGVRWIREDAAGKPDFVTAAGVAIGVKAVKRRVPPQPHYTAQVTAQHAAEPVNEFFFMSYEYQVRRMWLLGGISRSEFLLHSKLHLAGESVHGNYQVREGHEIRNIALSHLALPGKWLDGLR